MYGLKLHGSAQQVNHRNRWRSCTGIHAQRSEHLMTRLTTRPITSGTSGQPRAANPGPTAVRPARVAVVGIHGHGSTHVRNALDLQQKGKCQLVAVADPRPPDAGAVGPDVLIFTDLDALLATTAVDIVVVCTPIHTHRQLAEAAMRAGADVLLEKPPVPTMAEFEHLLALCAETGRSCQIGFQSLGSAGGLGTGARRCGRLARRGTADLDPVRLDTFGRLLPTFALGRAPRTRRDPGDGRGVEQPVRACGGHRAARRRIHPRGGCADGRDRSLSRQQHQF